MAADILTNFFQFRNSRTGAVSRSNRTQVEDITLDGLPIRQWTKAPIRASNPVLKDSSKTAQDEGEWSELPMPKDSHLYEPHTQQLLRIARRGRTVRSTPQPVEEDKLLGDDEDADGEADPDCVFSKWQPLPEHTHIPVQDYLAPRRRGLPPVYGSNVTNGDNASQLRKTMIRKTDTEGNQTVLEVLVPEGQAVEGEIVADEAQQAEPLKPGTVVDGIGTVNAEGVLIAGDQAQVTPPRRRPPPPKRKAKGPGRGRKKKVMFGRNAHLAEGATSNTNNSTNGEGDVNNSTGAGLSRQDSEMGGDATLQEGEEGSGDEDEGDESDDDREDGELSPSPAPPSETSRSLDPPTEAVKDERNMEPDTQAQNEQKSSSLRSPKVPLVEPSAEEDSIQSHIVFRPPEEVKQPQQSNGSEQATVGHEPTVAPLAIPQNHEDSADMELGRNPVSEHIEVHTRDEKHEASAVQPPNEDTEDLHSDSMDIDNLDSSRTTQSPVNAIAIDVDTNQSATDGSTAITVENPSSTTAAPPQAVLPADTNPLEGLAEPVALIDPLDINNNGFPEGEEDLLRSLERTLEAPQNIVS